MGRKNSKKKKKQHSTPRSIQGTLDITRSGVGFVVIDKEREIESGRGENIPVV